MPIVELPDGREVEFPDSMGSDAIAKAIHSNFPEFATKPKRTWAEAAADTGAQLGEGVNNIIGAIPSLVAPESKVAGFFKENADFWRDQQSDPLKQRIAGADKAITAAGADGMVAQISEAASQYFSDPALAARFVTTNLPSMIPGIAAAKVAQAAALARGATAAKAAAAATTAAGGANAVLNAGGARGEAFEDIKGTLVKQGMSPEQAEAQAIKDSRLVAAIGGAAGFVSGKTGLEGAIAGRVASGAAVRRGAGAFASELAGEQLEEVVPKLATNAQAGQYDNRALTQDVGRTMVETAIGAGPGAIVSGVSAARAQPEPNLPPVPAPAEPRAEDRREPTWADTATPAQPAAPAAPAPSIADIGAAASVDEAIAAAQAVVSAPVATPVATPYATPADIDALEASSLTTQAGGIPDAVLPPYDTAGAERRDPAAAGLGAGDAGPAAPVAAMHGPQLAPAALDVQPGGSDLVRAGAGVDADPALTATPVRDALDKIIDPDTDWHAFPAETGTLNLPRADMPQIRAEHRGALTQFLKARGIAHQEIEVPAESLKPTQAEFSLEKVTQALNYDGGERSILVSSDGHVLDGHHQWLAAVDAERPVKAIVLDAPIRDLIDTVREFPSAAVSGGAPQQEVAANVSERQEVPEEAAPAQGEEPAPQAADDPAGATNPAGAAAPVRSVSKLDAARVKHQKQDEAVRKAAENAEARAVAKSLLDLHVSDLVDAYADRNGGAPAFRRSLAQMAKLQPKKLIDLVDRAKVAGDIKPPADALPTSLPVPEVPAPVAAPTKREAERAKLESKRKKKPAPVADESRSAEVSADATPAPTEAPVPAEESAAPSDPERDTGADIPRAFFKKVKVDHDIWIEDEGVMETVKERADVALKSVREDIANLKALVKCMKG